MPLYIGRSRHVRARVRQYFVASEPRTRMAEMVGIAERVDAIACAHPLEAEVRELRLIAEHKPRYNRRSRFPERASWVKLTAEPFPRLALVRRVVADGATYLGPFGSAKSAQAAMAAIHEAVPLRQCTQRITPQPTERRVRAGRDGPLRRALRGRRQPGRLRADRRRRPRPADRRRPPAARGRPPPDGSAERASSATRKPPPTATARPPSSAPRPGCSASPPSPPARSSSRPDPASPAAGTSPSSGTAGWPRASTVPAGADPLPYVDALVATAEVVTAGVGPLATASAEEMDQILAWLGGPGARLVRIDGTWCSPAAGAGGLHEWLVAAEAGRDAARPFDDRRGLRPIHRPARAVG